MCECGQSEQTVQHMLQSQLLDKPCSIQDLADATETAMMYQVEEDDPRKRQLMMDSTRWSMIQNAILFSQFHLFVCPSVCLSNAGIVSKQMHVFSHFWYSSRGISLVFELHRLTKFQWKPLIGGVKYTAGGINLRFSTKIVVYLGNGTREAHGCYGSLIGSHG